MWSNFFEAGGFGMFPTLIFGAWLVAMAGLYALRPEPRWHKAVTSLQVLTLAAGVLGTTVGLISTLRYVQRVDDSQLLKTVALGAAESLNNLALALILVTCSALMAAVAALRAARAKPT